MALNCLVVLMEIKVTWRSFCEAGHWKSRGI